MSSLKLHVGLKHLTPGGNKYFVSFIDEHNRMIWLHLIKAKSEVFEVFKRFKAMVERQSKIVRGFEDTWWWRVYL